MNWMIVAAAHLAVPVLAWAAGLLGLARAVSATDRSAPLQLKARIASDPPRLELSVRPASRSRARIEHLSISRGVADALGATSPPGFVPEDPAAPTLDSFAPDLEEIADSRPEPLLERIDGITREQHAEHVSAGEAWAKDWAGFAGRVALRRDRHTVITIPLARAERLPGRVAVTWSERVGFLTVTRVARAPIELRDCEGGSGCEDSPASSAGRPGRAVTTGLTLKRGVGCIALTGGDQHGDR